MSAAPTVKAPATPGAPVGAVRDGPTRRATLDPDAFDRLVEDFGGLLRAITRSHRLSDADAADVCQTAWLALLQNLDRIDDPTRVGAWLATTTRRECLRKLRARAREFPEEHVPEPSGGEAPAIDGHLLQEERDARLWEGFGRLPVRDQALLRMLVAEPQPSYEQVGSTLGMPVGSIGPTRARALERLRRELERGDALLDLVAC